MKTEKYKKRRTNQREGHRKLAPHLNVEIINKYYNALFYED